MHVRRVILTKHAYKRYRQRVGNMAFRTLLERLNTSHICGLYKQGFGLIKISGAWWECEEKGSALVLVTCYGKQDHDMIADRRRRGYAASTT